MASPHNNRCNITSVRVNLSSTCRSKASTLSAAAAAAADCLPRDTHSKVSWVWLTYATANSIFQLEHVFSVSEWHSCWRVNDLYSSNNSCSVCVDLKLMKNSLRTNQPEHFTLYGNAATFLMRSAHNAGRTLVGRSSLPLSCSCRPVNQIITQIQKSAHITI